MAGTSKCRCGPRGADCVFSKFRFRIAAGRAERRRAPAACAGPCGRDCASWRRSAGSPRGRPRLDAPHAHMRTPMPDHPKYLGVGVLTSRTRHSPVNTLLRAALPTLILVGLAAPVEAQTSSPPVASASSAGAATNPVRVVDLLDLPVVDENK